MERDKSLIRSKKSAITVAELLAKEGLTALVPAGGIIYDLTKTLVQHGRNYFTDRTEARLIEFHETLLSNNLSVPNLDEFIHKEFDLDDYYTILSSCTQDIENAKVAIYAKLMKSLIEIKIDDKTKKHFITSCKDLTFSEISFLKNLYINSKFDLMTAGGTTQQVKSILHKTDYFQKLEIDKLIQLGFINKECSAITKMAENFIEITFEEQHLTPQAIGRNEYLGIYILIISYQLGDVIHCKVAKEIQESLWSINIKSSIQILNDRLTQNAYTYSGAVLIVDNKDIDNKYINALKNFSNKKPLIKISISKNTIKNNITDINFEDEISLKSLNPTDIRSTILEYMSPVWRNKSCAG